MTPSWLIALGVLSSLANLGAVYACFKRGDHTRMVIHAGLAVVVAAMVAQR